MFAMLNIIRFIVVVSAAFSLTACSTTQTTGDADARIVRNQTVEASCGQCQFGMQPPGSCDLAVRIDGKPYFVDGAGIDDFGDAHAADGFCEAVRMASVSGTLRDGRFHPTEFALVP